MQDTSHGDRQCTYNLKGRSDYGVVDTLKG